MMQTTHGNCEECEEFDILYYEPDEDAYLCEACLEYLGY